MTEQSVFQLAQILALNAEALGMQAANMQRQCEGSSMSYTDSDFDHIAEAIRKVVE